MPLLSEFGNPLYQAARALPQQPVSLPEEEPQQPRATPGDAPSMVQRLAGGGLNALAAVGNLLDLPGSSVRDTLSLKNPFDQYLTPFSDENRTTGRDMLRNMGMAGKQDTWGNFLGGMAIEFATDPLTPLEGINILSRGGKALQMAGGSLKNVRRATQAVVDAKAKAAGKIAPQVTKTGSAYRMTPRSYLEMLPTQGELKKSFLDDLKKNYKPKEGEVLDLDNLSPTHQKLLDAHLAQNLNYEDALEGYRRAYAKQYGKLSDDIEREIEESLDKPLKVMASFRLPFAKTSYVIGPNSARSLDQVDQGLNEFVNKQPSQPEGPNGEPVITDTPDAEPAPIRTTGDEPKSYPVLDASQFKTMLDKTATSQDESDALFQVYSARAASAGMSLDDYVSKKIASVEKAGQEKSLNQGGVIRGSFQLADDGRAVIKAFEAQNVSTLLHETGHLFRRDLEDTPELLKEAERYVGVKKGNWSRDHEEKFAKAFEKYLADGQAPTKGLQAVFDKFKEWLTNVYGAITGSKIDVRVKPEIRKVFDALLTPQGAVPGMPPTTAPKAKPISKRAKGSGGGKSLLDPDEVLARSQQIYDDSVPLRDIMDKLDKSIQPDSPLRAEHDTLSQALRGYLDGFDRDNPDPKATIALGKAANAYSDFLVNKVKPAADARDAAKAGTASVPTMITNKMESDLLDLGYSQAEINAMKPQEAWDAINTGARKNPDINASNAIDLPWEEIPSEVSDRLKRQEGWLSPEQIRRRNAALLNKKIDPVERKLKSAREAVDSMEQFREGVDIGGSKVRAVAYRGEKENNPKGSLIADGGTRPMVVMEIDGIRVPFYQSTGDGGKNLQVGAWYPFFGMHRQDNWINKTNAKQMGQYYGSRKMAMVAHALDQATGNLTHLTDVGQRSKFWDETFEPGIFGSDDFMKWINEGMSPVPSSSGDKLLNSIKELRKRLDGDEPNPDISGQNPANVIDDATDQIPNEIPTQVDEVADATGQNPDTIPPEQSVVPEGMLEESDESSAAEIARRMSERRAAEAGISDTVSQSGHPWSNMQSVTDPTVALARISDWLTAASKSGDPALRSKAAKYADAYNRHEAMGNDDQIANDIAGLFNEAGVESPFLDEKSYLDYIKELSGPKNNRSVSVAFDAAEDPLKTLNSASGSGWQGFKSLTDDQRIALQKGIDSGAVEVKKNRQGSDVYRAKDRNALLQLLDELSAASGQSNPPRTNFTLQNGQPATTIARALTEPESLLAEDLPFLFDSVVMADREALAASIKQVRPDLAGDVDNALKPQPEASTSNADERPEAYEELPLAPEPITRPMTRAERIEVYAKREADGYAPIHPDDVKEEPGAEIPDVQADRLDDLEAEADQFANVLQKRARRSGDTVSPNQTGGNTLRRVAASAPASEPVVSDAAKRLQESVTPKAGLSRGGEAVNLPEQPKRGKRKGTYYYVTDKSAVPQGSLVALNKVDALLKLGVSQDEILDALRISPEELIDEGSSVEEFFRAFTEGTANNRIFDQVDNFLAEKAKDAGYDFISLEREPAIKGTAYAPQGVNHELVDIRNVGKKDVGPSSAGKLQEAVTSKADTPQGTAVYRDEIGKLSAERGDPVADEIVERLKFALREGNEDDIDEVLRDDFSPDEIAKYTDKELAQAFQDAHVDIEGMLHDLKESGSPDRKMVKQYNAMLDRINRLIVKSGMAEVLTPELQSRLGGDWKKTRFKVDGVTYVQRMYAHALGETDDVPMTLVSDSTKPSRAVQEIAESLQRTPEEQALLTAAMEKNRQALENPAPISNPLLDLARRVMTANPNPGKAIAFGGKSNEGVRKQIMSEILGREPTAKEYTHKNMLKALADQYGVSKDGTDKALANRITAAIEEKVKSAAEQKAPHIQDALKALESGDTSALAKAMGKVDEIDKANKPKGETLYQSDDADDFRTKQQKSPAFKAWFGDWESDPKNASKVVDDSGKPIVVYHGTGAADLGTQEAIEHNRKVDKFNKDYAEWSATHKLNRERLLGERNTAKKEAEDTVKREVERLTGDQYIGKDVANTVLLSDSRTQARKWHLDSTRYVQSKVSFDMLDQLIEFAKPIRERIEAIQKEIDAIPSKPKEPISRRPMPVENAFETGAWGANDGGYLSAGSYFTRSGELAGNYAQFGMGDKKGVLPVYLNLRNPFIHGVTNDPNIEKLASQKLEALNNYTRLAGGDVDEYSRNVALARRQSLEELGYDGEIYDRAKARAAGVENKSLAESEYVAFHPEQIKSAIGNKGSFDPKNSNILYQSEEVDEFPGVRPDKFGFYLKSSRVIDSKVKGAVPYDQLVKMLRNAGVKQEELDDLNFKALEGKKKITRQELADHIENNLPQMEELKFTEATLRPDELERYIQLRDGMGPDLTEDELQEFARLEEKYFQRDMGQGDAEYAGYQVPGGDPGTYREFVIQNAANTRKFNEEVERLSKEKYRIEQRRKEINSIPRDQQGVALIQELDQLDRDMIANDREMVDLHRGKKREEFKGDNEEEMAQRRIQELRSQGILANIDRGATYTGLVYPYGPRANMYKHSHWHGIDDPMIHIRVNDQTLPDGSKMLRVQEVQSDWHQAGRERGYRGEYGWPELTSEINRLTGTNLSIPVAPGMWKSLGMPDADVARLEPIYNRLLERGPSNAKQVPNAPFKKSWDRLALKRILTMAAKEGYDSIGIVHGGDIAQAVGGPKDALTNFYDTKLTSEMRDLTKKYDAHEGVGNIAKADRVKEDIAWDFTGEGKGLVLGSVGDHVFELRESESRGKWHVILGSHGDEGAMHLGEFDTIYQAQNAADRHWKSSDGGSFTGDVNVFTINDKMRKDLLDEGLPLYQSDEVKPPSIKEVAKKLRTEAVDWIKQLPSDKASLLADVFDQGGSLLGRLPGFKLVQSLLDTEVANQVDPLGQKMGMWQVYGTEQALDEHHQILAPIVKAWGDSGLLDTASLEQKLGDIKKARDILNHRNNRILDFLEGRRGTLMDQDEVYELHGVNVYEGMNELQPQLELMRGVLDLEIARDAAAGLRTAMYKDAAGTLYFPRWAVGPGTQSSFRADVGRILNTLAPHQKYRELRDLPGGTSLLNKMSLDKDISATYWDQPILKKDIDSERFKELKSIALEKYAPDIVLDYDAYIRDPEAYFKSNPKEADKLNLLVSTIARLNPWHLEENVPFTGYNILQAFGKRFENGVRTREAAKSLTHLLATTAYRGGEAGHHLGELMREVGLRGNQAPMNIIEQMGDMDAFKKFHEDKVAAARKELEDGKDVILDKYRTITTDGDGNYVLKEKVEDVSSDELAKTKKKKKKGKDGEAAKKVAFDEVLVPKDKLGDYIDSAYEFMDRNGYKVPRNVKDIATRAMRPFTMPENFSMLERIVRKLTTFFRAHVTGPFLPFHIRNLLNGISNSVFYGAYDPSANMANRYTKPIYQADLLRRGEVIKGIADETPFFKEKGFSDEEATAQLAEWAFVHGVVGERIGISSEYLGETLNRYSAQYPGQNKEVDPFRYLLTLGQKGGLSPAPPGTTWMQAANPSGFAGGFRPELSSEFPYVGIKEYDTTKYLPLRVGSDMSSQIEDYNRLSKFIAFIKQGYSPKAAADQVKKIEVDYSNLTQFEKRFARVIFPFWTFSSRTLPNALEDLIQHPNGPQAWTVRAMSRGQSKDGSTPDHIQDTANIQLSPLADGTKQYITGFGLSVEDPLSFAGALTGDFKSAGRELLARSNPLIKAPIEYLTGQSLFQDGPFGGRMLNDMDPPMGRTVANLKQLATGQKTEGLAEPLGGRTAEFAVASSPFSRYVSYARSATDPRKWESPGWQLLNLTTGVRMSQVSPAQQDSTLINRLAKEISDIGGRKMESVYVPDWKKERMSPAELARAEELEEFYSAIQSKSRERRKGEREAKELQQAITGKLPEGFDPPAGQAPENDLPEGVTVLGYKPYKDGSFMRMLSNGERQRIRVKDGEVVVVKKKEK